MEFFFTDLGLSLGAKLVPTNDRPSFISIICRHFASGGENKYCAEVCPIRLDKLQGKK